MSDERLNATIDEVAREMTDGALDGGAFRRRVLARIATDEPPRRSVARRVRPRAGCRRRRDRHRRSSSCARRVRRDPRCSRPSAGRVLRTRRCVDRDGGSRRTAPHRRRRARQAVPRRATRRPGPFGPGVAPAGLDGPANCRSTPLDVAPLTVDALAPDSIQIPRLEAIAPIDVAPLDVTDDQRRNE